MVNVRHVKDMARSGGLNTDCSVLNCSNTSYFVEFAIDEDVDGPKISLSSDSQNVLNESFNVVSIRK